MNRIFILCSSTGFWKTTSLFLFLEKLVHDWIIVFFLNSLNALANFSIASILYKNRISLKNTQILLYVYDPNALFYANSNDMYLTNQIYIIPFLLFIKPKSLEIVTKDKKVTICIFRSGSWSYFGFNKKKINNIERHTQNKRMNENKHMQIF